MLLHGDARVLITIVTHHALNIIIAIVTIVITIETIVITIFD